MSDRYRTEYKSGGILGLTPKVDHVIDRKTGEYVGEVAHWDHNDVGELIAEGKWEPYKSGSEGASGERSGEK